MFTGFDSCRLAGTNPMTIAPPIGPKTEATVPLRARGSADVAPLLGLDPEALTQPIRLVPERPDGPETAGTYVRRSGGISAAFRITLITASTAVAFAPAIWNNIRTILDGSPTAYLVLAPLWALIVAYSVVYEPRHREINDAEFDMILTVVIMSVAGFSSNLALPRIPAAAAFWHAELVLPMIWIFGLSIASFGVRRAFRAYPAWLFVAACFPPNFLILGGVLGGSTVAFGWLTVGYAVAAVTIALRRSKRRWYVPPILLVGGGIGVLALEGAHPAMVYLVPAGVVTVLGALSVRTSHQPFRLTLPPRSMAFVVATVLATVLTVFVAPRPAPYIDASDLVRVQPDWVNSLQSAGIKVSEPTTYGWGPRILGDGGSARRFRLEHEGMVAYLDVFSSRDLGRFASTRVGVWYGAAPPAHVEQIFRSRASGIQTFNSLDNRMGTIKSPDDPVWAARGWYWRYGQGPDTIYQSVYLVTSRASTAPDTVPTPQPPGYVNTVALPIAWLIRAEAKAPDIPPYLSTELTDLARQIATTASEPRP
jgi:hypothetical protein